MKTGCVAILDALGFKGIWKTVDPDEMINKLKRMRDTARELASRYSRHLGGELTVRFFSDTVIFACEDRLYEAERENTPNDAEFFLHLGRVESVRHVCMASAAAMLNAAKNPPFLNYRGCIAWGAFKIDEEFIIGPAVDEAASTQAAADGAFVWLCPSAVKIADRLFGRYEVDDDSFDRLRKQMCLARDYPIPLKDGRSLVTHAVNPLAFAPDASERQKIAANLLSSFDGDSIDVALKRQNTETFLARALQQQYEPTKT